MKARQEGQIYNEHCLKTMKRMKDDSIDLVLTDPPYGRTANDWDIVVDFMEEALRVSNLVVMTSMQPYSSELVVRFKKYFKYELIWKKNRSTNFLNAKKQPLRNHEQILVFSRGGHTYNPQMTHGHKPVNAYTKHSSDGGNYGVTRTGISGGGSTSRYPKTVVEFKSDKQISSMHPTQKPVALFEYLVKTYSNKGDTIYDPFMGSGTTGVAAMTIGRDFIGSEISKEYYEIADNRLLTYRGLLS